MGNVEEQVKELIAGILNVSAKEVTEDTAIGDIAGWDSLHHLQILSGIEKHFNIRFTPDIMMDLEDVGDIVRAAEERVK